MGRRGHTVLVVVLVAVAGCSGFAADGGGPGGGNGPSDPAVSVTPAPVPETAERAPRAPGLGANGIENASALGAAHDAVLENTSFAERVAWTFRYPNGSFYQGRWRVTRVGASKSRYYDVRHQSGAWLGEFRRRGYVTTGVERWSGGEETVRADVLFDGTRRYSRLPAREAEGVKRSVTDPGGTQVARLLRGTETRVTGRVVRDGRTFYRVGALGLPASRLPTDPDLALPADVSLSALVGEGGLVRSYTVTYTTRTPAGAPLTVAYVVQYGGVGETRVERPAWYDAARRVTSEGGGTNGPDGPNGPDDTNESDGSRESSEAAKSFRHAESIE